VALHRSLCSLALVVLAGCTTPNLDPGPTSPVGPSGFPCPSYTVSSGSPRAGDTSGRVQVGAVSYPAAPSPYQPVDSAEYLPFANLVGSQRAVVEPATATSMGWESVVALARLSSVDGAWGTAQAAEVVAECSLSQAWRGIDYRPTVSRDEALTVDGHEGWIRITTLDFAVPGVKTTSEVQTVVVIRLRDETYAYLSYLPGSAPNLRPIVDATREGLRVNS